MHGKDMARKAIAKLREKKSAALSDISMENVSRRTFVSPGLKEIEAEIAGEDELTPTELTSLSKRIQEKRLTAPGLSREESHGLIERLGLKHRRG